MHTTYNQFDENENPTSPTGPTRQTSPICPKEMLLDILTPVRMKYSDFFKDINIKEEEIYNVN